jgi:branched-chain amino acid transport system ATP-binding protein
MEKAARPSAASVPRRGGSGRLLDLAVIMTAILETRGLKKYFGGLYAINGVDLSVERGELRCLIGPNGAGKSTLFKLILGTYAPSEGHILFKGDDITTLRPHLRIQRGLSIKFQVPGIFVELPVDQNLRIALQRSQRGARLDQELERLLELIDLEPQRDVLAGHLSHGQQQWLEIAMAVALRPAMLLLDEPTAGMSPEETYKTGELVKTLNATGMTIVVIEHDMAFVRQIAKRVTVLHFGQVFDEGSLDDIVRNEDVVRIYLGKA